MVFLDTGEAVAVKLESVRSKHPQLMRETKIYRSLHGLTGLPTVRFYGVVRQDMQYYHARVLCTCLDFLIRKVITM